jgi:hypothetical protein
VAFRPEGMSVCFIEHIVSVPSANLAILLAAALIQCLLSGPGVNGMDVGCNGCE